MHILNKPATNRAIYTDVIPKLMEVIENSGLTFHEAKSVPKILDAAINAACERQLVDNKFSYQSRKVSK